MEAVLATETKPQSNEEKDSLSNLSADFFFEDLTHQFLHQYHQS